MNEFYVKEEQMWLSELEREEKRKLYEEFWCVTIYSESLSKNVGVSR